jgi:hypothetical protein
MNRKEQIKLKHLEEKLQNGLKIVGKCKCGNALFISTVCEKKHIFNYYCTICGSVGDVRFPKTGDSFNTTAEDDNPIKLLISLNEKDGRNITDEQIETTPISDYVNKGQGAL